MREEKKISNHLMKENIKSKIMDQEQRCVCVVVGGGGGGWAGGRAGRPLAGQKTTQAHKKYVQSVSLSRKTMWYPTSHFSLFELVFNRCFAAFTTGKRGKGGWAISLALRTVPDSLPACPFTHFLRLLT